MLTIALFLHGVKVYTPCNHVQVDVSTWDFLGKVDQFSLALVPR